VRRPPVRLTVAVLALSWVLPALAQTTVFTDAFTEATTNTDLVSHAPDVGTGWAEVIDTAGANTIQVYQVSDTAGPSASGNNHLILYTATPVTPCGEDCDVSVTMTALGAQTDRPLILVFGYVDASNYCGLAVYEAAASPDVAVFKVVAGTPSDLASGTGNTAPAVNDVFLVENRAGEVTVKKNTVSILTPTPDSACAGTGVGLGFGAARVSTDDSGSGWRVDAFTVVNQTAGSDPGGGGTGGGGGLLRRSGGWR
jgi:hypothetical protein